MMEGTLSDLFCNSISLDLKRTFPIGKAFMRFHFIGRCTKLLVQEQQEYHVSYNEAYVGRGRKGWIIVIARWYQ